MEPLFWAQLLDILIFSIYLWWLNNRFPSSGRQLLANLAILNHVFYKITEFLATGIKSIPQSCIIWNCISRHLLGNLVFSIICLLQNNRFPINWHQNNQKYCSIQSLYLMSVALNSCICRLFVLRKYQISKQLAAKQWQNIASYGIVFDASCFKILKLQYFFSTECQIFQATGIKIMTKYCIIWNCIWCQLNGNLALSMHVLLQNNRS